MPQKTWAIGEEVLAADFNTYVQQQVIAGFANAAARTAGLASPVRGQASYLSSGDATEGPEFWNGVNWRKPWNQSWGEVGYVEVTSAQASFGPAATDITGATITFVAIVGRKYEIMGMASIGATGGATNLSLSIADGANAQLAQITTTQAANGYAGLTVIKRTTPGAGSVTYKLRASSGATMTMLQNSLQPTILRVHDVGPSGVPS